MRKNFYLNFLVLLVMVIGGILPISAVYNAKSVIVNTGQGSGSDFAYTLLGINDNGNQIWGWIKNTDKYAYTYWKIDGGKKLSYSGSFTKYDRYAIDDDYTSAHIRTIGSDKNESYFLKVNSQSSADIIYCDIGGDISSIASDFYVYAKAYLMPQSITFDGTKYTLNVIYNIAGPTEALFKNAVAEVSFDGGNTWTKVDTYDSMAGLITTTAIWDKIKVKFRVTAYPQDNYKSIVKEGRWVFSTADIDLPQGISCSIDKTPTADEMKSSYNAEKGTFNPEITWNSSENMTNAFQSADLYYSHDKGKNWTLAKTVTSASGTASISVAPGYTSYMFRIAETPVYALSDIDAFKPSATAQGPEISYTPAIESVTLSGNVTDGYNATDKTYTHTVKVAINSDLQITMKDTDKPYINYSTDEGKTWSENIPVSFSEFTGEATVTVPVAESYIYRFSANSYVDDSATAVTAQSEVYTASEPSGIDVIATDSPGDNSPVDVYNLAGNLVARQIILSKASDILSNGIYVVKGKLIVVNK